VKLNHRTLGAAVAVLAMAALTSCGSGSSGSAADGTVTLSFLMGNDVATVPTTMALAAAGGRTGISVSVGVPGTFDGGRMSFQIDDAGWTDVHDG
jgi:raffinose/stachyose/melibiose transport system substrate-binding protein